MTIPMITSAFSSASQNMFLNLNNSGNIFMDFHQTHRLRRGFSQRPIVPEVKPSGTKRPIALSRVGSGLVVFFFVFFFLFVFLFVFVFFYVCFFVFLFVFLFGFLFFFVVFVFIFLLVFVSYLSSETQVSHLLKNVAMAARLKYIKTCIMEDSKFCWMDIYINNLNTQHHSTTVFEQS